MSTCLVSRKLPQKKERKSWCKGNRIILQILMSLVHSLLLVFSSGTVSWCLQDQRRFGLLHKQEEESWGSRWLLPSSNVVSPGELHAPDLIVSLTVAHNNTVLKHKPTHHNLWPKQDAGCEATLLV